MIVAVGLAIAALVKAIPLLGQKLENRILAARKADARENPIEQHQNAARREAARIQQYEAATKTIRAQIDGLQDMVADQRKKDPHYDFSRTKLTGMLAALGQTDEGKSLLEGLTSRLAGKGAHPALPVLEGAETAQQ